MFHGIEPQELWLKTADLSAYLIVINASNEDELPGRKWRKYAPGKWYNSQVETLNADYRVSL